MRTRASSGRAQQRRPLRPQRPQQPQRPLPPAPRRAASESKPARPQRKLRARADGAAHARRRRRLHAEGRHRGGARVYRLDDPKSPCARRVHVRAAAARRPGEDGPRPQDSRRRHEGRRAGARHPRRASVDRPVHLDEAGAPVRQRHAAGCARRPPGRTLHRHARRSARGHAHAAHVAGISRAGLVLGQDQDAVRVRRQRGEGHRRWR